MMACKYLEQHRPGENRDEMHSELEIHESKQRRPVFQPIEAPCTVLAAPPLNLKLTAVCGHQYVSPLIPISENASCMLVEHKWGGIVAYAVA